MASPGSVYELGTQSSHFYDDFDYAAINELLRDLLDRTVEVTDRIAETLFPDEAFGFPINGAFISNFEGSFLNTNGYLNPANFATDIKTTEFLNRMISTIAKFIRSTGHPHLENVHPLRYFTSLHSNASVPGSSKRKPDMTLPRLIDGCTREGQLWWEDLQGFVEHIIEEEPLVRMVEAVIAKDYLSFCTQPDRDFLINLCITKGGFHIVIADRTGLLETDVIPFDCGTSVLIFIRMVMGLALLPGNYLGLDPTIQHREGGRSSGSKFDQVFPPFPTAVLHQEPCIQLVSPVPTPLSTARPLEIAGPGNYGIFQISIGTETYRVTKIIFMSRVMVGPSKRLFLAITEDGRQVVIKDIWVTRNKPHEAKILGGVAFSFCPTLIGFTTLGNTRAFRSLAVDPSLIKEI